MSRLPAVLLLTVALAGCSVTSSGVTTTASTPAAQTSHAASTAAKPKPAGVGDTIVLKGETGGEKIAVKLVKVDPTVTTDSFEAPNAKHRLFAAQFRIKDVGTGTYNDSPTNGAEAIDSHGQQYDTAIVEHDSAGPQFPATTKIPSGESALGWIVFTVPKHAKITRVQFSEDSGFGQTGQWQT